MSRKKRSKINFNPGIRNGVRKGVATATAINEYGVVYKYTYNNQVQGEHNRSKTVTVIPDSRGFRRPAPYRVFACDVDRQSFGFKYYTGTFNTTNWYASGLTDTANGFGWSFMGYLGTKLAGGLRVPDVSQNFENQVVTEALLKLQDSDLNLLVSLAESVEAVTTIASLIRSLAKLLDRFCRDPVLRTTKLSKKPRYRNRSHPHYWRYVDLGAGRRGRLGDPPPWKGIFVDGAVSYAEKAWLSTMYAMFPLIAEIEAAIAVANSSYQKEGAHFTVLRSMTKSVSLPLRPLSASYWRTSGYSKIGCECQLAVRVDDPGLSFLAAVGLDNPLAVFWEVTPYSFVVDWLLPLANSIRALTSSVGLSFDNGFINHLTWSDFEIGFSKYPQLDAGDKMPTVRYRNVCQLRSSLVTMPLPGIYIKSPFSAPHITSAYALVAQLVR